MKKLLFFFIGIGIVISIIVLLLQTNASSSYILEKNAKEIGYSESEYVYHNKKHQFSISYPQEWTYREYEGGDGVGFQPVKLQKDPVNEFISISVFPKPINLQNIPFENYVNVAAINEIQNYTRLASLSAVKTQSGLIGYKTTWYVTPLGGGAETISLPITYFPTKDQTNSLEVFLNKKEYIYIYDEMIQTIEEDFSERR